MHNNPSQSLRPQGILLFIYIYAIYFASIEEEEEGEENIQGGNEWKGKGYLRSLLL